MNPFKRLLALIPQPRLLYGTVIATTPTGVLVELPGGERIPARGEAEEGDTVFVRDGVIEGPAPGGLTYTAQEI